MGDRWYVLHSHGADTRHGHPVSQWHAESELNPRANNHDGVDTVATFEEAKLRWREQTYATWRRG